ncbi:uncharacterized protein LOC124273644 [Haliotis rubra]|uniref:uncharacterized protein LOC124273644 n=1 Tax=Haliotis rubra TaxID=36100 RepID=UPI001EE562FA|nr:uncharacterized protein LOC124273644 [Haliotis rubra]
MRNMQLLTTLVAAVLLSSGADGCPPYVELATTTTYNYQSLHQQGVELTPGATSFKFKVRASNDAHVALLQDDGVTDRYIYEIVIGGWRNTQSVIRTGMQHDNRVTARHRPLSATRFRDFWISWDSGVISVGTGTAVGAGRFMSWRDPSPHPVRYIAVSTGWGSTGVWRFEPNVPSACLETGDDYHYHSLENLGFQLNGQTSFTFWVKTTNDAHIALLSNRDNYDHSMFEIVIGGWRNTQSVIRNRKQGPNLASVRHMPLSGSKHQPFWISFSGSRISVGSGRVVGRRTFLSWIDQSVTQIRYVSVATGWGSTGKWIF